MRWCLQPFDSACIPVFHTTQAELGWLTPSFPMFFLVFIEEQEGYLRNIIWLFSAFSFFFHHSISASSGLPPISPSPQLRQPRQEGAGRDHLLSSVWQEVRSTPSHRQFFHHPLGSWSLSEEDTEFHRPQTHNGTFPNAIPPLHAPWAAGTHRPQPALPTAGVCPRSAHAQTRRGRRSGAPFLHVRAEPRGAGRQDGGPGGAALRWREGRGGRCGDAAPGRRTPLFPGPLSQRAAGPSPFGAAPAARSVSRGLEEGPRAGGGQGRPGAAPAAPCRVRGRPGEPGPAGRDPVSAGGGGGGRGTLRGEPGGEKAPPALPPSPLPLSRASCSPQGWGRASAGPPSRGALGEEGCGARKAFSFPIRRQRRGKAEVRDQGVRAVQGCVCDLCLWPWELRRLQAGFHRTSLKEQRVLPGLR